MLQLWNFLFENRNRKNRNEWHKKMPIKIETMYVLHANSLIITQPVKKIALISKIHAIPISRKKSEKRRESEAYRQTDRVTKNSNRSKKKLYMCVCVSCMHYAQLEIYGRENCSVCSQPNTEVFKWIIIGAECMALISKWWFSKHFAVHTHTHTLRHLHIIRPLGRWKHRMHGILFSSHHFQSYWVHGSERMAEKNREYCRSH